MTLAPPVPAGTWSADPLRSTVGFAVEQRSAVVMRGRFKEFAAHLTVGPDGAAQLAGSASAASLVVAGADGAARPASAAALDAARFPRVHFASFALDVDGDLVQLDGRLTVKGITLPVTAGGRLVSAADGDGTLLLTLGTLLDPRQFGVGEPRAAPGRRDPVPHETRLQADLVLRRSPVA